MRDITARLDDLIARLEKATGPDRELGRDILLACGWRKTCVGHFYGPLYHWSGPNGESFKDDDFYRHDPTLFLDTAIRLLPPGFEWLRKTPNVMTVYREPEDDKEWARHIDAKGANAAIALTIAALKARAALQEPK